MQHYTIYAILKCKQMLGFRVNMEWRQLTLPRGRQLCLWKLHNSLSLDYGLNIVFFSWRNQHLCHSTCTETTGSQETQDKKPHWWLTKLLRSHSLLVLTSTVHSAGKRTDTKEKIPFNSVFLSSSQTYLLQEIPGHVGCYLLKRTLCWPV